VANAGLTAEEIADLLAPGPARDPNARSSRSPAPVAKRRRARARLSGGEHTTASTSVQRIAYDILRLVGAQDQVTFT
jgi:hypothetical protein